MCPDRDKNSPEKSPAGVGQPIYRRRPCAHQQGIEHPLVLQQPFPNQGHYHRRQQHRVKEHTAPETPAYDFAVEHQRGEQRQQHHQHHLDQAELDGVENGAPEHVLAAGLDVKVIAAFEQDGEIFSACERALLRHQVDAARQGVAQVDDDGQKSEQPEHQQIRPHKQPADARAAQHALPQTEQRLKEIEKKREQAQQNRHEKTF